MTLPQAMSDEGMWLLSDPPRDRLQKNYSFTLTDAWLQKAMLASVRLNNGGSGGFVSPDGLVITNHHVAAEAIQNVSTKEQNFYRDGFYASSRDQERKCPNMEFNVLQSIEDVTMRVNDAAKKATNNSEAAAARRAIMAEIEKESLDKTGLRSDVVTLYQGGLYHLYRYKKYTDVRLVFAPEASIGGFGGDVDNFEFPRHGLDISFFRVYENNQPAKTPHFFKWSQVGPKENDLAFVTGHPGTTNRGETVAKLLHRRDVSHPYTLARLRTMEAALLQYGESSPEAKRQSATEVHKYANARKAFSGQYQGLLAPETLISKQAVEKEMADSDAKVSAAFETIKNGQAKLKVIEKEYLLLETGHAFASELFTNARHLVRLPVELKKPSGQRLREYRDSNLESLKQQLFSTAPIYTDLERVKLTTALTFYAEQLGGEALKEFADVKDANSRILNPAKLADQLLSTALINPEERKKMFEAGSSAIDASNDPMIKLAKAIDEKARVLRKQFEETIEEPERQAYSLLSDFRFQKFGKTIAPDATFTLRLAYGQVKGYEVGGKNLPFHTTIASAFDRAASFANLEPFDMPKRWQDAKPKLDLTTPFNFVSTADTIGGNSGSPVLNQAGELIGVNFDRNRHGLVRNFVYTDVQARHIAVHCRIVLEALEKVYAASELLKELKQ